MRRREFSLLCCLLVGLPLAARAQQSAKIARIGWMSRGNASAPDGTMNAFRQGMHELGACPSNREDERMCHLNRHYG